MPDVPDVPARPARPAGPAGEHTEHTDRSVARWRLHTQGLTAPRADSATEVVRHLLAVQAENPAQSAWAVATRTRSPDARDLAALLDSGEVVRTHTLRSTWHYVLRSDIDWLQQLTGPRLRPLFERGLRSDAGLEPGQVDRLTASVCDLLAQAPDRLRPEIADHLREQHPDLAERVDGRTMMYLLGWCEVERLVVSGRARHGHAGAGSTPGASAEPTYARWEDRVGPRTDPESFDRDAALAQIARRYVTGHGPATAQDLAYWATLPLGEVRRGLADAADERADGVDGVDGVAGSSLRTFEHDGRTYWYAGEPPPDLRPAGRSTARPRGHLLQLLDEIYRGYQDSRWVLDADGVVPRGRETAIGIALVDGQLVAGMRRHVRSRAVRFELTPFRPLTSEELTVLEDAAGRYGRFLGLAPEVSVSAGATAGVSAGRGA